MGTKTLSFNMGSTLLDKNLTQIMTHNDPNFWHGRVFSQKLDLPEIFPGTKATKEKPRSDHSAPDWLTATEYQDVKSSLAIKADALAELLLKSKKTVLYTGAGISASVIGQAAKTGINKTGWLGHGTQAAPTAPHYFLSKLVRENLIHSWIQQNHDGLPQKAGCPQHRINEIHGAWFDSSNPVGNDAGTLRDDLYHWMQDSAKTADLVIALGTSLSGLNADQMVEKCALRKNSLGSVMINLQQTKLDGMLSLKLYGKTDGVLGMVMKKLKLKENPSEYAKNCHKYQNWSRLLQLKRYKIQVPFDKRGDRLKNIEDKTKWSILDLNIGAKVKLHRRNN